ncbi:MAG: hypothetical protein AAGK78_09490, partial [Planctomycetota bacterium]
MAAQSDADDDVAAFLSKFEADQADDGAASDDTTAKDETVDAAADIADDIVADETQSETQEDVTLGLDTLAALMAEEDDAPLTEEDKTDNIFDGSTDADDDTDAQEDAPAAPRARVIKVKRADIEAAIASGALEEVSEDAAAPSSLSDEREAELLAELAEVEAELADVETALPEEAADDAADIDASDTQDTDDKADDQDAAEQHDDPVAAHTADAASDAPVKDDDVQRLMAEADSQMEEPEGSRRRNAFQHLKAAVMAKKADAAIGENGKEDEGAFRSDLASVVRPRRPTTSSSERAQRPGGERPAPLKLVAEQRVDTDAAPKGPVRPRRVATPEETAQASGGDGSFAEYASEMGAHDLPALLEAAASYLSFVEGRDAFSRPQLMTKVRQVEQGDFSREDGLRSFGQLLRAGKIEKIKGGRFAVTGDIGYRPDQR